jgi:uncharacterized protein YdeI (YjbR/CyaY-like superfamily)
MGVERPGDAIYFTSPEELGDWFDANHDTATELWLGSYKKATGKPTVTWSEAVDAALCVGWIDSVRYSLDPERSAQRFTPRRKGSNWSAVNIAKVKTLTEEGRMKPAGLAAFEARTEERSAIYSYERRHLAALAPDEDAAFRASEDAWDRFQALPPSYRQTAIYWVVTAKKPETRVRRLATLIEDSAAGRRLKQLTPRGRAG